MSKTLTVCVTGAAGQIGTNFIPLLCTGTVFGENTNLNIRLLDIPKMEGALQGIALEIEDGAYPLVLDIKTGSNPEEMFKDIDVGVFVGGFPRLKGMERSELISKNSQIFVEQGKALDKVAKKSVKCVVIANPANTNCLILQNNCPSIPKENFTCLTRLDQNRAKSQIAIKAGVNVNQVRDVIIWGNHSATQYPSVKHGTVNNVAITEVIKDEDYYVKFLPLIQKRGAQIIEVKGSSSVFSAANAVKDHLRDWYLGSNQLVSMGVITGKDNFYGVPENLCFSFPLQMTGNFEYKVVSNLAVDEEHAKQIQKNVDELLGERAESKLV